MEPNKPNGTPRPSAPSTNRPTSTRSGINRPATARPTSTPEDMRLSAEEKLKRSMKNLSYTSGGAGTMDFNSKVKASKPNEVKDRKKVGGVVLDLETIETSTNQKMQTKNKRNNVIILVLCLLLAVSLVYLAISIINYNNGKRKPNCKYSIRGSASAQWIVQDSDKTEVAVAPGLESNMIYKIKSEIKINTLEACSLIIEVNAYINNEPITFAGLEGMHDKLLPFKDQPTKYKYDGNITGGGTILLFTGIDFTDAPYTLTSQNVNIEVIAYVEKI